MITRRAFAKLNLALAVAPPEPAGGPRAGWHRVASWFHAVELADTVEVAPAPAGPGGQLLRAWAVDAPRPGAFDWPAEKDLAARAAAWFAREAGLLGDGATGAPADALPVSIALIKSIPVGGGLGGGSADAAATIQALCDLARVDLEPEIIPDLARLLGSDVPYFLDGQAPDAPPRPALVTGFGDAIERTPRVHPERSHLVLVLPPFGCDTRAVYAAYDRLGPRPLREGDVAAAARAAELRDDLLFNDLFEPACAVQPALRGVAERTCAIAARPAHMTGSGSTLFVLARDAQDATDVARRLRAEGLAASATRLV